MVAGDPARTGVRRDARGAGRGRLRGRPHPVRRARCAPVEDDAPAPGPAARQVRQRLALARRPVAGDAGGRAAALDGRQRRGRSHPVGRRVLAGLWWWRDDAVELDVFTRLSRQERGELDAEVERVDDAAARPSASGCGRAAPPSRRRRPSRCAAPRCPSGPARPPGGERRQLLVADPALGPDDDDDRAAAGHRRGRPAGGRVLVEHDGAGRVPQQRDDVVGRRQVGHLGEPRAAGLLGGLAGGRAPLGQRLVALGRHATPRPSGRRPTARSRRRRSRSASPPRARRGRPSAAPGPR